MPTGDGSDEPSSVLRGLFGAFTSAAADNADTATIWSNLRDAATSWARQTTQAIYGSNATDEQIEARAQQLLGGVTIQDVNQFRSYAGAYEQARQNAQGKDPATQFDAGDIFTAPWSRFATTGGAINQFRANVTFRSTFAGFQPVELSETRSFLIGSTLTNANDLIEAAKSWYSRLPYNSRLSDVEVTDFALERV